MNGRVQLADFRSLARFAARSRRARLFLVLAALVAVALAIFLTPHRPTSAGTILRPGSNAIVVVDVSASISYGDVRADRDRPLQRLRREGGDAGLILFSDTAYQALPPGTPVAELAPFERFFRHPAADPPGVAADSRRASPWTCSFSAGTRISTGLSLALDVVRGASVARPLVILVSDLDDDAGDLESLTSVALAYRQTRHSDQGGRAQPVAGGRAVRRTPAPTGRKLVGAASRRAPRGAFAPTFREVVLGVLLARVLAAFLVVTERVRWSTAPETASIAAALLLARCGGRARRRGARRARVAFDARCEVTDRSRPARRGWLATGRGLRGSALSLDRRHSRIAGERCLRRLPTHRARLRQRCDPDDAPLARRGASCRRLAAHGPAGRASQAGESARGARRRGGRVDRWGHGRRSRALHLRGCDPPRPRRTAARSTTSSCCCAARRATSTRQGPGNGSGSLGHGRRGAGAGTPGGGTDVIASLTFLTPGPRSPSSVALIPLAALAIFSRRGAGRRTASRARARAARLLIPASLTVGACGLRRARRRAARGAAPSAIGPHDVRRSSSSSTSRARWQPPSVSGTDAPGPGARCRRAAA